MEIYVLAVFVLGYFAITIEHTIKIDKLIPALSMMAVLWAVVSIYHLPVFEVDIISNLSGKIINISPKVQEHL